MKHNLIRPTGKSYVFHMVEAPRCITMHHKNMKGENEGRVSVTDLCVSTGVSTVNVLT